MMKNARIKKRLVSGFLIVAILTAIVGVVGIYGMTSISNEAQTLNTRADNGMRAAQLIAKVQEQRATYRGAALRELMGENAASQEEVDTLMVQDEESRALLAEIKEYISDDEVMAIYNEILPEVEAYIAARDVLITTIQDDNTTVQEISEPLNAMVEPVNSLVQSVSALVDHLGNATTEMANELTATAQSLSLIMIIVIIIAVAIAIVLGLMLANGISKPLNMVVQGANLIAVGDISASAEYSAKDEIGDLIQAMNGMVEGIRQQADVLEKIADGDFTATLPIRSDKDVMNQAINNMLDSNNSMMGEIREAASQVASGSVQIADGAQALATGSTEQAATLEEFSATINQVQVQSEENNTLANQTLADTEEAGRLMGESMEYMQQMTDAMTTINESSQNIAKVIKVIDDIAFQTNILALNAAVEAARAGQHGKGFAVVADEVRNLASKSAAAAKETADLIENSVSNVDRGTQIAQKTSESLTKVGEIAAGNATAMAQLSESSQQQSNSITEINQGIGQISSVVQANSATAEESAASAEELSAQSALLDKIVARFKMRENSVSAFALPKSGVGNVQSSTPELPPLGDELF